MKTLVVVAALAVLPLALPVADAMAVHPCAPGWTGREGVCLFAGNTGNSYCDQYTGLVCRKNCAEAKFPPYTSVIECAGPAPWET